MNDLPKGPAGRRRRAGSTYTTSSGKTLKLNQSIGERRKASKFSRDTLKATYLSTLPKNKLLRVLHRMHPRRVAAYWFSREGAIMALKIAGVGVVICFFLVIGVFAYFRKDLPKIKNISGDKLGGSITYLDRTGTTVLFQDYDAVKRVPVADENISPFIKQATVAIEDKDFYKHGAFDVRGITRAATHDVVGGGGAVQGGSTITQQLVKLNEQWTTNRTITRKVKELILAVELEREYTKKDILTAYLNIAPYGGIEYGVETAARDYFHTTAKDLTLSQATILAAIPQSPYRYSPYSSPEFNAAVSSNAFDREALIGRQHYILDQMVNQKMITKAQATEAKTVDVLAQVHPLESKYQGIKAPYFVLAAKQELERKYGAATVQRSGWVVTTTLDINLQNLAESQVAKDLPAIRNYNGDNAAFVAEDVQTGQMVALVGGVDFSNDVFGKINYAQTPLPPGSSFKPYDYASLINFTAAGAGSVLYDTQGPIPGYPCTNKNSPKTDKNANCLWDYDFRYPGPLTLRYSLGGSRNVPAIKAMLSVVPTDQVKSVNKVISTAEAMQSDGKGFGYNCYLDTELTKKTQCYAASAIGDGAFLHLDEHVNGLATMSRLGSYIPQTYIMKIINGSGKTINQWKQPNGKQVLKDEAAYIVNDMLSDPNASYLPSSFKFQHQKNGWKFAVKTGTTNDNFDGLMTSWSTKYAVATWVGNHTRNVALKGSMEYVTEPIVRGWMEAAHTGLKPVNWTAPPTVKTLPAFVIRSHVGIGSVEPSTNVDLFPSWYQPKNGTNVSQTIDKVSGKLATSCTPAAAKIVQDNSNTSSFSIDKFVGGGSAAANSTSVSGNDDVHNCDDAKPQLSLTTAGNTITVTASQGTHPLSGGSYTGDGAGTIIVTANGQTICSLTIDNPAVYSGTCQYTPTGTESIQLSAVLTDSVLYQDSQSGTLTPVADKKKNN
ncbi:MAG: transglycosylase domain-containing protein [Candidatus Saccharimonadales bacterium]